MKRLREGIVAVAALFFVSAMAPSASARTDCGMLVDWAYHGWFTTSYYHGGSGYPGFEDPDDPDPNWENQGSEYGTNFHDSLEGGTISYHGIHAACTP